MAGWQQRCIGRKVSLHQRNLGFQEYGTTLKTMFTWLETALGRTAWSLENHDIRHRITAKRYRGAHGTGWSDINNCNFQTYLNHVLGPICNLGDNVIMDNLVSHKGSCVRTAIKTSDVTMHYLPPYSPGFNSSRRLSPNLTPISVASQNGHAMPYGTGSAH